MRIKAWFLAGLAAVSLVLLTVAGPTEEPRGGVVLNPDPPQAPTWGLKWDLGELPRPAGLADGVMPAGAASEWVAADPSAQAGVWATPAEFSETD